MVEDIFSLLMTHNDILTVLPHEGEQEVMYISRYIYSFSRLRAVTQQLQHALSLCPISSEVKVQRKLKTSFDPF